MRARDRVKLVLDELSEIDEPVLLADGLDVALIGYTLNSHMKTCAVYDFERCVAELMKHDRMTEDQAREFLEFNTLSAYIGEHTPIYVRIPR